MRTELDKADTLGGLARGLSVIEAFNPQRPRASIADIARATGLTRAAARRCLLTLQSLGYAEFDGKFFTLTPRVLRLGVPISPPPPCPRSCSPSWKRCGRRCMNPAPPPSWTGRT
ncbi:helix-turn-helix domain-containing protein [Pseudoroseomonas wenyumeiae]